ncbi:MAG: hypothetical protein ACM3MK_09415 [Chitinophagales bacterium]
MKRINKYSLPMSGDAIWVPANAEILSIQTNRRRVLVYALVDPQEKELKTLLYKIIPTGGPVKDVEGYNFMGSIRLTADVGYYHVFIKEVLAPAANE